MKLNSIIGAAILFTFTSILTHAQSADTNTNRTGRPQQPRVISPEISADRKITFRILAPKATDLKIGPGDIQGLPQGATTMMKGTNDIWEVTIGPSIRAPTVTTSMSTVSPSSIPATPPTANPTKISGASFTSPARISWIPKTFPTAPSPKSRTIPRP